MPPKGEKRTKNKRGRMPKACVKCRLGKAKCVYTNGNSRCDKCISRDYECVSLLPGQTFEDALELYNQRGTHKTNPKSPQLVCQAQEAAAEKTKLVEDSPLFASPQSDYQLAVNTPFLDRDQQKTHHRMSLAEASAVAAAEAASVGGDIYQSSLKSSPHLIDESEISLGYFSSERNSCGKSIPVTPNNAKNQTAISRSFNEPITSTSFDFNDYTDTHMSAEWMQVHYNQQNKFSSPLYQLQNQYHQNDPVLSSQPQRRLSAQFRYSHESHPQQNLHQLQRQQFHPQNSQQLVFPNYAPSDSAHISSPLRSYEGNQNFAIRSNSNSLSLEMSPQSIISIQSSESSTSQSPQSLSQLITPNLGAFGTEGNDIDNNSTGSSHLDSEMYTPFALQMTGSPQENRHNSLMNLSQASQSNYSYYNLHQQVNEDSPPKVNRNIKHLEINVGNQPVLSHYHHFNEPSPTTPTPSANYVALNLPSEEKHTEFSHPSNAINSLNNANNLSSAHYSRESVYEDIPEDSESFPYEPNNEVRYFRY